MVEESIRRLREALIRKLELGLFLFLCTVLFAGVYVIYIADDSASMVLRVMELGGFIGGVVRLVLAVSMLWFVGYAWWKVSGISGGWGCAAVIAALTPTVVLVPVALLLPFGALLEMIT